MKTFARICVILGLMLMTAAPAMAGMFTETLGEFSSPYHDGGTYYDDYLVGTFTYDLMGEPLISAVIEGTWGNSVNPTTADNELWLDGILLADTHDYTPSPRGAWYVPWSHTFAPSEFAVLLDGIADLHTIQTSEYVVRLGETTLRMETGIVPVPGAAVLGVIGLGYAGLRLRRKKA